MTTAERRVWFHADDLGATPSVSATLLRLAELGRIDGVSLLVNGAGVPRDLDRLRSLGDTRLSLHLDLTDTPLCTRGRMLEAFRRWPGPKGYLGFAAWTSALDRVERDVLRREVAAEVEAQLVRFLELVRPRRLEIDGHLHFHMAPVVLDALLTLSDRYPLRGGMRLPRPVSPWLRPRSLRGVARAKLLERLARRALRLAPPDFFRNDRLWTQDPSPLEDMRQLQRGLRASLDRVEVLLHPGRATPAEAAVWQARPDLKAVYAGAARQREEELLAGDDYLRLRAGLER